MVNKLDKVVYRAQATSTGGRDGVSRSSDGQLDIKLGVPKEMGGAGVGVNPEQLFAAGYSACFIGAMRHVAGAAKIALPANVSIDATVGIGPIPQGFGIEVQMVIHLPGLDTAVAEDLIAKAHQVCPYSNATRGNVEVTLTLAKD
ncbi:organic hydroperoxide resistance protein [Curvibacter sp. CHRR-16]|uniref:organic hydroperoxide resistance protein n=1 Tax=Curvibacter sp. CHRR-16 TaxID=2835872 RepID=UPI001BDA172B|nr:organic hydroperoxide resistance protein [Curvibacter sp. CHRR-16]MBT0570507.1 organic hydroperoxide resistance protein [Curvibacter sp. CHRR-16]